MRALEGSGPAGLAGMPAVSGVLVRPLLAIPPRGAGPLREGARAPGLGGSGQQRSGATCAPGFAASSSRRSGSACPKWIDRLRTAGHQAARERAAWDAVLDLLPGLDPRAEDGGISVAAAPSRPMIQPWLRPSSSLPPGGPGSPWAPRRAARVWLLALAGASGREVPLGGGWRAELAFGRLRIVRHGGPSRQAGVLRLAGVGARGDWGEWRITWRPRHGARAAGAVRPHRLVQRRRRWWCGPGRPAKRCARWREPGGGWWSAVSRTCGCRGEAGGAGRCWPRRMSVVWIPGVCRSDALLPPAGAEALRVDVEHA